MITGGLNLSCDRRYQNRVAILTAVAWDVLPKSEIWTRPQRNLL